MLAGGKGGSEVSALTDRELEVYPYIGEGKTSREIAGLMGISIRTVDAHRTHIKDKLGLRDAADLTYQAIRWVKSQSPPPSNTVGSVTKHCWVCLKRGQNMGLLHRCNQGF